MIKEKSSQAEEAANARAKRQNWAWHIWEQKKEKCGAEQKHREPEEEQLASRRVEEIKSRLLNPTYVENVFSDKIDKQTGKKERKKS